MRGWVYLMSNQAMPGLVKVGFTMKDPALRAQELEQTGVPHPFVVDYEVLVDNPRQAERLIHLELAQRIERKEWFRCTVQEAVVAVRKVVGAGALLENTRVPPAAAQPERRVLERPATATTAAGAGASEPAGARLRLTATFNGCCQYCGRRFSVTLTRHDSGAACPHCLKHNRLDDFIGRELPR